MTEKNYTNEDLITYLRVEEEKDPYTKQLYWNMAIGLQQVDNLNPSKYLKELVNENVQGKISNHEVQELLKDYYKKQDLSNKKISEEQECDLVSTSIVELLNDKSFSFRPISLKGIHEHLFKDIYNFAGKYRDYNISKEEIILNGDTVNYGLFNQLDMMLDYDFNVEKEFDYSKLDMSKKIERFADFTSRIWEAHPFGEGNTRTTAVFMIKYLRSIGYKVNNDLFKEHSVYFRNALIRGNYNNVAKNVSATPVYLIKFYENLLDNKQHELRSRDLIVKELFEKQ